MISINYGTRKDTGSWMSLVQKVSSSFPGLETEEALTEHRRTVLDFMDRQEAIYAKENDVIVGVLLFSKENNILCFLAVDPIYRRQHIAEKMFRFILPHMSTGKPITVTTYRDGVPEGVAARAFYQKLGFVPGQMTVDAPALLARPFCPLCCFVFNCRLDRYARRCDRTKNRHRQQSWCILRQILCLRLSA